MLRCFIWYDIVQVYFWSYMRPYYGKIYFYTFVDYYASYGYISLIIVGKMLGFKILEGLWIFPKVLKQINLFILFEDHVYIHFAEYVLSDRWWHNSCTNFAHHAYEFYDKVIRNPSLFINNEIISRLTSSSLNNNKQYTVVRSTPIIYRHVIYYFNFFL